MAWNFHTILRERTFATRILPSRLGSNAELALLIHTQSALNLPNTPNSRIFPLRLNFTLNLHLEDEKWDFDVSLFET